MCSNTITTAQASFNDCLTKKVNNVFSALYPHGDFCAFQHPAGFHYFTSDGVSWNCNTLQTLDSLVTSDDMGNFSLEIGGFSKLYADILQDTRYDLSQETQKTINDASLKYNAQIAAVIQQYNAYGLPKLSGTTAQAQIVEIYSNCASLFGGEVTESCDIIPNSYASFKAALQTLNNMAGAATQVLLNVGNKNGLLSALHRNLETPGSSNGGILGSDGQYHVGYTDIPSANTLIGSLDTDSNALTITITGVQSENNSMRLTMDNEAHFIIPIFSLLDIAVDHTSIFTIDQLISENFTFETSITYSGITVVPVQPTPADLGGKTGWYEESRILRQIAPWSAAPAQKDGYRLVQDHDLSKLIRLQSLLISKKPSITVTMNHVNMEYAKSVFQTNNDVSVSLFGFLRIGTHKNDYTTTDVKFNEETQSVTLTFGEPNQSGTPDPNEATAFVLGGAPVWCTTTMQHVPLLPTEGGKQILKKDDADLVSAKVLYKRDAYGYRYYGMYDDNALLEESGDYVTIPLTSAFVQRVPWRSSVPFANILGSTKDTHPNFHKLANRYGITWTRHEQKDVYDCFTSASCTLNCNGNIVGGHVIRGTMPASLPKNSNFYVIPIDGGHNSSCINHGGLTPGNGNGFYMMMDSHGNNFALEMRGYLTAQEVANALGGAKQ